MAEFSISLWVRVDADSYEEAYKMASEIESVMIDEDFPHVCDAGVIDVECQNEDFEDDEDED